MAIFFLNIIEGATFIRDIEGHEFSSLYAAQDEAVHSLREIIADRIKYGKSRERHRIEITSATGKNLATVELQDRDIFGSDIDA